MLQSAVYESRKPGRFLLTGSAYLLPLPRLADSLDYVSVPTVSTVSQAFFQRLVEGNPDPDIETTADKRQPPQ